MDAKKKTKPSQGDFLQEVLSDEIHQALKDVSDENDASLMQELKKDLAKSSSNASNVKKQNFKTNVVAIDERTSRLENVSDLKSASQNKRNPIIDLKNADYIKFAQEKINRYEQEISDLRVEVEQLAQAGDHFKALSEERELKIRSLEAKISENLDSSQDEKKILNETLKSKETKIKVLQERVEFLEGELESRFNRLRVRERELESRLEILKQEQEAVASSKDDMILKLKKQINSLQADLEKSRNQNQKVNSTLQEKEDALRRTVKALKLSLTMLESQNK